MPPSSFPSLASSLTTVLLVEDDTRLAQLTAEYLSRHGYVVTIQQNGTLGLEEARRHRFDVILLDLMLPGRSGLEICRELRTISDVPILVLTARSEEADRVVGLEMGADDYLVKPFSPRELVARIQAILRRSRGQMGPRREVLQVGSLVIDPGSCTVSVEGRDIPVTGYEFALLRALAERPGRVMTREQLMERAAGSAEEAFDRSIDVHISRLRQKLGDDGRPPRLIRTIRGSGYLLAAHGDRS